MGRPAKDIDPEMVSKLAKIGCRQEDIAKFLDCSQSAAARPGQNDSE
jgi:hypothetical protein